MKKYNKLIRDLVPKAMDAKGVNYKLHIADNKEYLTKLKEKILEEVHEYLQDNNVEELADIIEVVHALSAAHGLSIENLEQLRMKKSQDRGGFKDKLILDEAD